MNENKAETKKDETLQGLDKDLLACSPPSLPGPRLALCPLHQSKPDSQMIRRGQAMDKTVDAPGASGTGRRIHAGINDR